MRHRLAVHLVGEHHFRPHRIVDRQRAAEVLLDLFRRSAVGDFLGLLVGAEEHDFTRGRPDAGFFEHPRQARAAPARVADERIAARVVVAGALEADDLFQPRPAAKLRVGQLQRPFDQSGHPQLERGRLDRRRHRIVLHGEEQIVVREVVLETRRDPRVRLRRRQVRKRHDLFALRERGPTGADDDACGQQIVQHLAAADSAGHGVLPVRRDVFARAPTAVGPVEKDDATILHRPRGHTDGDPVPLAGGQRLIPAARRCGWRNTARARRRLRKWPPRALAGGRRS